MSKAAIGQALELLQELPDSDQQAVIQFLKGLKSRTRQKSTSGSTSALQKVNDLLIFTGEINDPGTDWLKIIRAERDHEILGAAAPPDCAE